MVAKNDHTGHKIQTKNISKKYEENFETIFGQKCTDKEDCSNKEKASIKKIAKEQDCV